MGNQNVIPDYRNKDFYEDFSKRWTIATGRLLPYLKNEDGTYKRKKSCKTKFVRTSHTFTYVGGM